MREMLGMAVVILATSLPAGNAFLTPTMSRSVAGNRLTSLRAVDGKAGSRLPLVQELGFDSAYIGADGKPRGFCNWLLPGKVMVGRYPHGTPFGSKTGRPDSSESKKHIQKVVEAGITTFVCLQEEVPPQDEESGWNGKDVIALADEQMRARYPQGFQRYFSDATEVASSLGSQAHFLHFPIKDFGTPGVAALSPLLDDLSGEIKGGSRAVYIHCWGGRGRAGTVGACLLLKLLDWDGVSADDAAKAVLETVQAGYDSRIGQDGGGSLSPETNGQREFVAKFARTLLSSNPTR